jgi:hypothetical protein
MAKNKYKTTKREIILSIIALTIFLSGIVFASLSLIGEYILPRTNNWVAEAEVAVAEFLSLSLSWLTWGSLFIIVGVVLLTINLSISANEEQVQREKATRRAQRLQDTLES